MLLYRKSDKMGFHISFNFCIRKKISSIMINVCASSFSSPGVGLSLSCWRRRRRLSTGQFPMIFQRRPSLFSSIIGIQLGLICFYCLFPRKKYRITKVRRSEGIWRMLLIPSEIFHIFWDRIMEYYFPQGFHCQSMKQTPHRKNLLRKLVERQV